MLTEFFRSRMLLSFLWVMFLVVNPRDLMLVTLIESSLKDSVGLKGFIFHKERRKKEQEIFLGRGGFCEP